MCLIVETIVLRHLNVNYHLLMTHKYKSFSDGYYKLALDSKI